MTFDFDLKFFRTTHNPKDWVVFVLGIRDIAEEAHEDIEEIHRTCELEEIHRTCTDIEATHIENNSSPRASIRSVLYDLISLSVAKGI